MSEKIEKNEECINSLCKKYFTPELCEKPVTESKIALKNKIFARLLEYGDNICYKKFPKLSIDIVSNRILDVIESCFTNWGSEKKERNYSSYFFTSIKNELVNFIKSKKESVNVNVYELDKPIGNNEDMFLHEIIEDENANLQNIIEREENLKNVENYLKAVDSWFKIRKREDWNRILVTAILYDGLRQYFDYYPSKTISRFSFIVESIYNLPEEPSNKDLAKILQKDEGQLSKAKKRFREDILGILNQSNND